MIVPPEGFSIATPRAQFHFRVTLIYKICRRSVCCSDYSVVVHPHFRVHALFLDLRPSVHRFGVLLSVLALVSALLCP